jgi:hypothetical protein
MAESAAYLVDQVIPQVLASFDVKCRLRTKSNDRIGSEAVIDERQLTAILLKNSKMRRPQNLARAHCSRQLAGESLKD